MKIEKTESGYYLTANPGNPYFIAESDYLSLKSHFAREIVSEFTDERIYSEAHKLNTDPLRYYFQIGAKWLRSLIASYGTGGEK